MYLPYVCPRPEAGIKSVRSARVGTLEAEERLLIAKARTRKWVKSVARG
jgi:hypothetical protein